MSALTRPRSHVPCRATPLRVTEAEAVSYADRLADHLREGSIPARQQFLSSFIRRIVFYGDEGDIELTETPAGCDGRPSVVARVA